MNKATNNNSVAKVLLSLSVGVCMVGAPVMNASADVNRYTSGGSYISSPQELLAWQDKLSRNGGSDAETLIAQDMRLQAMFDFAKKIAIRAAMTSRLEEIEGVVERYSRELDSIYNFAPLMIQQRVVPPVITEARNIYNQDGRHQIRLSDAIYNIESQAYFSSTPPNWRSYLSFNNEGSAYSKLSFAAGGMQPANAIEEDLWQEATERGWALGLAQSNVVLEQAMLRLNRDYIGMIKFHLMVLDGQITMPSINSYNLYDNNQGNRLILGEELLQIDVLPQFKSRNSVLGNKLRTTMMNELNMSGATINPPAPLTVRPIKEVYDISERIRNDVDITEKPWVDTAPLARSVNPLEQPINVNVEVYRTHKLSAPTVVAPFNNEVASTDNLSELDRALGSVANSQEVEQPTLPLSLIPSGQTVSIPTFTPSDSGIADGHDNLYELDRALGSVANNQEVEQPILALPLPPSGQTVSIPTFTPSNSGIADGNEPIADIIFGTEDPELTRKAFNELNNR